MDIKNLIEEIKAMSVLELNELVKAIEEEFGVSAAATAVVSTAPGGAAPVVEEKTEFNIILKDVGANKIAVIKAIREITGLGLVEAKGLAENGKTIKEGVNKEDSEKFVAKFKEAGATAVAE